MGPSICAFIDLPGDSGDHWSTPVLLRKPVQPTGLMGLKLFAGRWHTTWQLWGAWVSKACRHKTITQQYNEIQAEISEEPRGSPGWGLCRHNHDQFESHGNNVKRNLKWLVSTSPCRRPPQQHLSLGTIVYSFFCYVHSLSLKMGEVGLLDFYIGQMYGLGTLNSGLSHRKALVVSGVSPGFWALNSSLTFATRITSL